MEGDDQPPDRADAPRERRRLRADGRPLPPTVRLFVAVWPSAPVAAALAARPRPDDAGVRWVDPERWHVTLRFLGDTPASEVDALVDRLARGAAAQPAARAEVGPATVRLGPAVLVAPVAGLDALAAAMAGAARPLGPDDDRAFVGHLTLARARERDRPVPGPLVGTPVAAAWTVTEVALVRSHLTPDGPEYHTLATCPLGGRP